jgi:hypothetical protein
MSVSPGLTWPVPFFFNLLPTTTISVGFVFLAPKLAVGTTTTPTMTATLAANIRIGCPPQNRDGDHSAEIRAPPQVLCANARL